MSYKFMDKVKNDKTMLEVNNEVVLMSAQAMSEYLSEIFEKAKKRYGEGACIERYFANEKGFFHVDGYKFYRGFFGAQYMDSYCVIANDRGLVGVLMDEMFEGENLEERLNYALHVLGADLSSDELNASFEKFIEKRKKFLDK